MSLRGIQSFEKSQTQSSCFKWLTHRVTEGNSRISLFINPCQREYSTFIKNVFKSKMFDESANSWDKSPLPKPLNYKRDKKNWKFYVCMELRFLAFKDVFCGINYISRLQWDTSRWIGWKKISLKLGETSPADTETVICCVTSSV